MNPVIPNIEDMVVAELERRIVAAMPDTAAMPEEVGPEALLGVSGGPESPEGANGLRPPEFLIQPVAENFITTIESRAVERNVQEQGVAPLSVAPLGAPLSWTAPGAVAPLKASLTVYAWVTAEIVVIFYSQKWRYDYSRLIADFSSNPLIKLGEGIYARIEMKRSETANNPYMRVTEGPYLSSDAWRFEAKYPVISLEPAHDWEEPRTKLAGKVDVQ